MPTAAAQSFILIDKIKEDIALLKDGSPRVILMCSSLNFALKSSEEQDAITLQFQQFLNSLDFPLQFVIHSRLLNIKPYLESLKKRAEEEQNEYLKIQIGEYVEFIQTLVGATNIMSKTFYTIVPYTPPVLEQKGLLKETLSSLGFGGKTQEKNDSTSFEEHKTQLWQRVDTITEGLRSFGVRSVPLNSEEILELFYELYNPAEFESAISRVEE